MKKRIIRILLASALLIGCGMGIRAGMTLEACKALDKAQLVIGAKRWTDAVDDLRNGLRDSLRDGRHDVGSVRCIAEYRAEEIRKIIEEIEND